MSINNEAKMIMEAISFDDAIRAQLGSDLDEFPAVKIVEPTPGTLKAYNRITMNQEERDSIYYDVTNATDDFKETYRDIIRTFDVTYKEPIVKPKKQKNVIPNKGSLINLVAENEAYIKTMTPEERDELEALPMVAIVQSSGTNGYELISVVSKKGAYKHAILYYNVTNASDKFYERYGQYITLEARLSPEDDLYHFQEEKKLLFVISKK